MATTNKVKGWSGVFMTEDSSSHWPTKRRHVYYQTSRQAGLEFVCVFGHDDQATFRQAAPQGYVKRLESKLRAQVGLHRPADDTTREQIEDDRQVEPAFPSPDEGYVRHPELVRSCGENACWAGPADPSHASAVPRPLSELCTKASSCRSQPRNIHESPDPVLCQNSALLK